MRLKFFHVPAFDPAESEAEVNRFLAGHRVATIDRHLMEHAGGATWALCVTYLADAPPPAAGRKPKVDYKELLSAEDFDRYAALRRLRKDLAERDGVPPYALFTNEQLATLVRDRVSSRAELAQVPGVGPARVKKYGGAFLELLAGLWSDDDMGGVHGAANDDPAQ